MNSTHWTTLTGFAKYLGKEGKAVVDETEKGWFVAYIDRDQATIARQAARDQRNAAEVDEEVRESRKIEQQIAPFPMIMWVHGHLSKQVFDMGMKEYESTQSIPKVVQTKHSLAVVQTRLVTGLNK